MYLQPSASSPAPKPSSMSVLEVLKRPEYKLENIRKDAAAAAAAETIDLTSDDDEDEVVKEISKSKGKVTCQYYVYFYMCVIFLL